MGDEGDLAQSSPTAHSQGKSPLFFEEPGRKERPGNVALGGTLWNVLQGRGAPEKPMNLLSKRSYSSQPGGGRTPSHRATIVGLLLKGKKNEGEIPRKVPSW